MIDAVPATAITSGTDPAESPDPERDRLLLVAVFLLAILAVAWLSWLLWSYVPAHANVFAVFGIPLPRPAIIALLASNAFVRYLPYLVLLVALGGLAGGTRLVARTIVHPSRATLRPLLAGAISMAVACGIASVFVVWGIHTAYAQAAETGLWEEAERRLDAYRAEHPSK